ncbi:hypothetical protein CYK21_00205 [Streptococcus macedonicus]|uniref:DUF1642 domain-containing protein n=2 Tax=Streptococcus TaxID=1301 RepID=A0AAW6YME6_9STRE|nr:MULTISPECIES: DUF1642 domain-containing protein [Streptococcus]MDK7292419.1 DUF1642 domain-containing protein [Streptococcus pasteurianus]MDK7292466.1 DUF1642 domain-containing protein [Streptococcus pasteurianus]PLA54578.1 hypothetical protein CYK21_00205 [Streptococcus macedonicus]
MKKQEAIEKIENAIPDFILNDFQRGKETGLTYALELVEELDEPEKVVVSKLEAEWLDKLKAYYRHREDRLYVITRQGWGNDFCFSCHGEQIELSYEPYKGKEDIESVKRRLVNAILYGYEVEKEKLYTAKNKITNSYLGKNGGWSHYGRACSPEIIKHSKSTWRSLGVWDNDLYEIAEVKDD